MSPEPRVDLNQLDLQPLFFEEAFGESHLKRGRRITPARVSDPDFLRVGVERCSRTERRAQEDSKQNPS